MNVFIALKGTQFLNFNLEGQLRFRKIVLKRNILTRKSLISSTKMKIRNYVKLTLEHSTQLESNVKDLIDDTLREETIESKLHDVPLLVGKYVKHQFKEKGRNELKVYRGKVISVVPAFPNWYNTS